MTADESPATPDPLERGVRLFVDGVCAETRRRGGGERLTPAETRAIAEAVRAPWRAGGPAIARTLERRTPGDHGVKVRIYDPRGSAGDAPNGAMVYLHGGGWTMFSLDTHDRLMREYAARSGLTVVGVEYSLSPEARFPQALDEVADAIEWLRRDGASLGIDSDRLAIGGDSAGANLALAAALMRRDRLGQSGLRGLLLSYGCFRPGTSPDAARRFGGPGFMLTAEEMAGFWQGYLGAPRDAENPLACPLLADLGGLPPTFLAIAECDILAEQSRELAERLESAGVDVHSVVYPGAAHSFLEAVSVSPLAVRALEDASEWLHDICA